jgi:hypothetical protein
MTSTAAPLDTLLLFGATGDLSRRYLIATVAHLMRDRLLPATFRLVAIGRQEMDDAQFRQYLREHLPEQVQRNRGPFEQLLAQTFYVSADLSDRAAMAAALAPYADRPAASYLAIPPDLFVPTCEGLEAAGLLADRSIKPAPADIAFARDAFRDLLRIRASTPLFRLGSAAEIRQRLRFPNSGARQDPVVVAGLLDGRGRADAVFDEVLYFVNASPRARSLRLPELAGRAYVLHPVLAAPTAADHARLAEAHYSRADGRFDIPPRTALVYVLPRPASTQVPARLRPPPPPHTPRIC